MNKDTLFAESSSPAAFTFNEKVAEVFDDMLLRSVPNYQQVVSMTGQLLDNFLVENDLVYDLGCSTGQPLVALASQLAHRKLHFTGMDNSEAMISKARLKAEMYSKEEELDFILTDITTAKLKPCGAVILNYTLQFLRPLVRHAFLEKIYQALRPGGVLVITEKVISHQGQINNTFIDLYHDFKRQQGYSELEISQKREALENILIPFSISENKELLSEAGFTACETFCQWFNFVAILAIKENTP